MMLNEIVMKMTFSMYVLMHLMRKINSLNAKVGMGKIP